MDCPNCKNDLWIEQKVLRLAAMPSADPRLTSKPREAFYRLVCAFCSHIYGADVPIKKEKENGKQKRNQK